MKFIKENWFKLLLIVLLSVFLFLYSVPIYTDYKEYKADKLCRDYTAIESRSNNSIIIDCILRNPNSKEMYKSFLKADIKKQTQNNEEE